MHVLGGDADLERGSVDEKVVGEVCLILVLGTKVSRCAELRWTPLDAPYRTPEPVQSCDGRGP